MKSAFTKLMVRLPEEVKTFVEIEALRNGNSQNSEIIRCIREKMDRAKREENSASAGK